MFLGPINHAYSQVNTNNSIDSVEISLESILELIVPTGVTRTDLY